ncbi:MAG: hypothetical protein CVU05_02120 [Bacteroidetes bacterium HGW-Bacteroidetes-21]|jgi:hypothetical protein|nr:MAG: hypothetical protein CVU05_02120 [Bacteroidetes bacterium HGW-Bacteroidetes-21]
MDISVFMDKEARPDGEMLSKKLAETYADWQTIRDYVFQEYPKAFEEWNYSGPKYGWSFRIKDKKRAIVYLLPRKGFFKVAMIFGVKASEAVFASVVSDGIKKELQAAKVYAEGRGIRIDVTHKANLQDIKTLIDIKLAH